MEILDQMLKRAQENPQRIVLPEGDEPRTLEAANILLKDKVANLILIGDPAVIRQMAEEKGYEYILKGENLTIVDPLSDPKMPEYANLLFELRKAKGMTEEEAAAKFGVGVATIRAWYHCKMLKGTQIGDSLYFLKDVADPRTTK